MDLDKPINPVFKVPQPRPAAARNSHARPAPQPQLPREHRGKESTPPSNTILFLCGVLLVLLGALLSQLFITPPSLNTPSSQTNLQLPPTPQVNEEHTAKMSAPKIEKLSINPKNAERT